MSFYGDKPQTKEECEKIGLRLLKAYQKNQIEIEELRRECDNWEKKYLKVTNDMYNDITELKETLKAIDEARKFNLENVYKLEAEVKTLKVKADKWDAFEKAKKDDYYANIHHLVEANDRLAKAQDTLDAIVKIFNRNFGIRWMKQEFNSSNYSTSNSVDASDSVIELLREKALGGESTPKGDSCTKGEVKE